MAPKSSVSSMAQLVPSSAKKSSATSTQNTGPSRLLTPTTNPIHLLSTSTARSLSLAYTAIVPLYYYLRATSLVKDPLSTLTSDLLPLAVVHALFCAACLPSAGLWNNGTEGGRIIEGSASGKRGAGIGAGTSVARKRKGGAGGAALGVDTHGGGGDLGSRVMPTVFALILTIALPPIPLTVLALCMGAPLYPTSLLPHTLVLAVHVSLLGFLPIFYTHGVSASAWRDVAAAWLPFDEAGVWAGTVGSLVGGWVGAIPIALDWDREWQKWPCTVIWGVAVGWTVGRLLTSAGALRLGTGVRINLSETVEIPKDMLEDEYNSKRE